MRLIHNLRILLNAIVGYCIKFSIDCFGIGHIEPLADNGNDSFIVSLTSYGRRVHSVVYYTLISLLKQTERASKIILWLDDSWNDRNVPERIMSLKQYGVEIMYYHDIKSYKKLIPTLKLFPNDIIITVDDDMIYTSGLLKSLMDGFRKNGKIQCTKGGLPKIYSGEISSYINWKNIDHAYDGDDIVPIGVGGVLYPPKSLDKDVLNEDAFCELAPNADDLWFWVMAKRAGVKHSVVDLCGKNYSFDTIYQYLHKGSALTHSNAGDCKNDIQLKCILEKYPVPFRHSEN